MLKVHRQDLLLDEISSKAELVVVSVQYRLAPEYPFPAGPEDCYDVADWLVEHAKTKVVPLYSTAPQFRDVP